MKFNIGVGCIDLFPHEHWGRLLGRTWRQFSHQDWRLNEPLGFKPLRSAISEYVRTTRGLNCTDEQILIVNGTQQAINLAAQVLLQQGDEVWLDEPSDSGIHIVCWLSEETQESYMIEQCRNADLGAQPLSRYCQTEPTSQAILLGFAAHSPSEIINGIKKLAQTLTH